MSTTNLLTFVVLVYSNCIEIDETPLANVPKLAPTISEHITGTLL